MDEVRVDLGERSCGEAREAGDIAANGGAPGGDGDEAGIAHRDDDDVRASSTAPLAYRRDEFIAMRGGHSARTEGERGIQTRGSPARHDGRARGGSERAVDEADGACAQDEDTRG